MSDEKHARYLADPETGHVELITADHVEDKQKAGWKDPEGVRANGYVWNRPEDQVQIDAQGTVLEENNKRRSDEAEEKADEEAKADADAEAAEPVSSDPLPLPETAPKESFIQRVEDDLHKL